jgi:hypothetical protein
MPLSQLEADMTTERYDKFVQFWGLGLPCGKTVQRYNNFSAAGEGNSDELYRGLVIAYNRALNDQGLTDCAELRTMCLAADEMTIRCKIVMAADNRTLLGFVGIITYDIQY